MHTSHPTPANRPTTAENGQLSRPQGVVVQRVPTEPENLNISQEGANPSQTSSTWSDHSTHGQSAAGTAGAAPDGPLTADHGLTTTPPDGSRVRPRPGFTCNADGSRMPLGPRCEFKIIDYGSSFFSETLAQATGGFRARDNYEGLRRLFESKKVAFRSPTRQTLIEVDTTAGQPVEGNHGGEDYRWHLIPTHFKQRVRNNTEI